MLVDTQVQAEGFVRSLEKNDMLVEGGAEAVLKRLALRHPRQKLDIDQVVAFLSRDGAYFAKPPSKPPEGSPLARTLRMLGATQEGSEKLAREWAPDLAHLQADPLQLAAGAARRLNALNRQELRANLRDGRKPERLDVHGRTVLRVLEQLAKDRVVWGDLSALADQHADLAGPYGGSQPWEFARHVVRRLASHGQFHGDPKDALLVAYDPKSYRTPEGDAIREQLLQSGGYGF